MHALWFPGGTAPALGQYQRARRLRELLKATGVAGKAIVGDKGFYGADLEAEVLASSARQTHPDRKDEPLRTGKGLKVRQNIGSCYDTLKDQLGLERHNARSLAGLTAQVLQKLCALAAAIWLNCLFGRPGRHPTAYDH